MISIVIRTDVPMSREGSWGVIGELDGTVTV
jgi:hypothetical protein